MTSSLAMWVGTGKGAAELYGGGFAAVVFSTGGVGVDEEDFGSSITA